MLSKLLNRSNWFTLGFIALVTKAMTLGIHYPEAIILSVLGIVEGVTRYLEAQHNSGITELVNMKKDIMEELKLMDSKVKSMESKLGLSSLRR